MIFKTFLLTAITLALFTAPPLATALRVNLNKRHQSPIGF
jgi:hypothetical protein